MNKTLKIEQEISTWKYLTSKLTQDHQQNVKNEIVTHIHELQNSNDEENGYLSSNVIIYLMVIIIMSVSLFYVKNTFMLLLIGYGGGVIIGYLLHGLRPHKNN